LLASLLTCRSFDIRYVVVDRADGEPGHVMVEVLFEDVDIGDLVDEARDFYNFGVEKLCWESSDGGYWLACDGTASGVVGNKYSEYYDSSRHGEIDWRDGVRRDYLYP